MNLHRYNFFTELAYNAGLMLHTWLCNEDPATTKKSPNAVIASGLLINRSATLLFYQLHPAFVFCIKYCYYVNTCCEICQG